MKKILLITLSVLSLLIIAAIFSSVWLINHPKQSLELVQKYILPKDLEITWDKLDINIDRKEALSFTIKADIENLTLKKDKPKIIAPVDEIHLGASVDLFHLNQFAIDSLIIKSSKEIYFRPEEDSKAIGQSIYEQVSDILDLIEGLRVNSPKDFLVDISSIKLDSEKNSAPVVLLKSVSLDDSKDHISVDATINIVGKTPLESEIQGKLFLNHIGTDKSLLVADIKLDNKELKAKTHIDLSFTLDKNDNRTVNAQLESEITYAIDKDKIKLKPKINISLTKDELKVNVLSDIVGIPGSLKAIKDLDLKIVVPQESGIMWSEKETQIHALVPLKLFFVDAKTRSSLRSTCPECEIPMELVAKIEGQALLSNLFSKSEEQIKVIQAHLELEQVKNKIFHFSLNADLEAFKKNEEFLFFPTVNAMLDVYTFKSLTKLLEAEKILVPAPIDTLDGTLNIKLSGDAIKMKESSTFPITFNVDLFSKNQKVKLKGEAALVLDQTFKKADLSIVANIQDVELVLPPLDPIKGVPRVVADPRILKKPKKTIEAKNGFQMNVDFEIQTDQPGAIKLKHKIFEPYIPLSLKLTSDPQKQVPEFIKTEPFDVVYLRRRLSVKKLDLNMSRMDENIIPIDARFQVDQTEYTVFIDVKGTLENPTMILSSDPYLPEDEIISVLLYNTTSGNLSEGDAKTSSNVQSAMANKAIGLFGLWAFASTPIKRFSYNPATNEYSAVVAISNSVTAEVGTNWEQATNVELHKRLSKRWAITAAFTPATGQADTSKKLVLQWEKRF